MRFLSRRLLDLARSRGADLRGDQKVLGFDGTTLDTVSGPIRARVFVDASGIKGPRLDDRPTPPPEDLLHNWSIPGNEVGRRKPVNINVVEVNFIFVLRGG